MKQLYIHDEDFLTLEQLKQAIQENSNHGIYCYNNAVLPKNDTKITILPDGRNEITEVEDPEGHPAVLNIEIGTPKESDMISLPQTWIPLDLADLSDPQKILISKKFKECYEAGYIQLVTKEHYELVMQEPEFQEERREIIKESGKAISSRSNLIKKFNKRVGQKSAKQELKIKGEGGIEYSPVVYEFTSKDSVQDEAGIYRRYKKTEEKLTEVDIKYIIKETQIGKIKLAAEKQLATFN